MNLVFAVCTEDSTNVANEKVSARLARLRNRIHRVQAATTPTFIVFVAPEFMFRKQGSECAFLVNRWRRQILALFDSVLRGLDF